MEILEILDKHLKPTGILKDRQLVHRDGDIHGVVRIHILRLHEKRIQMLLQKRSAHCEAFPGYYDIACAGHIQGKEDSIITAKRELQEELGICAEQKDFHFIGNDFKDWTQNEYKDKEYSYLYMYTKPIQKLRLQPEEVEYIEWFDVEQLLLQLDDSLTTFCILRQEVEKILKAYEFFMKL